MYCSVDFLCSTFTLEMNGIQRIKRLLYNRQYYTL